MVKCRDYALYIFRGGMYRNVSTLYILNLKTRNSNGQIRDSQTACNMGTVTWFPTSVIQANIYRHWLLTWTVSSETSYRFLVNVTTQPQVRFFLEYKDVLAKCEMRMILHIN